jgi:Fe-S-cluster containining protein
VVVDLNREGELKADPNRQCGSCYACCVGLGIEELKKWSGQPCRHLTGAQGPEHRCGIYDTRPKPCSRFQCAWKQGHLGDNCRPDECGFILVFYWLEDENPPYAAATITIMDGVKAGSIDQGPLSSAVKEILCSREIKEIRIVNHQTRKLVLFKNGKIWQGTLFKPDKFEELKFAAFEPHVGEYLTLDKDEALPLELESRRRVVL